MPVIESKHQPRDAPFQANAQAMAAMVADLKVKIAQAAAGGGKAALAKHVARGKLPPRERVQMLLDPGTPFLELSPLAALDMYNNDAPCAGVITGIGRVAGVECVTLAGAPVQPVTNSHGHISNRRIFALVRNVPPQGEPVKAIGQSRRRAERDARSAQIEPTAIWS